MSMRGVENRNALLVFELRTFIIFPPFASTFMGGYLMWSVLNRVVPSTIVFILLVLAFVGYIH